LLDLSPKIPPLASLVNGGVMAMAGQSPDAASWSLALWHALLLTVVGLWGRELGGGGFGLLAAGLAAVAPALAELRVDYTLDLPLAATTTLALWLLGRWQAPAPAGGRPPQALVAALAVATAILIKQSALLVVALPSLWAAAQGLARRGRRLSVGLAFAVVLGLILPWLHHNWISTLGGTNRAVVESAAAEGDPDVFSLASLLWYPRFWPAQLGMVTLVAGMGGMAISLPVLLRGRAAGCLRALRNLPPGWGWLTGCCLAGWLATTLSPNKDPRYITPVLPLLLLLLARGWWVLGCRIQARWGSLASRLALAAGLLAAAADSGWQRSEAITREPGFPVPEAMAELRRQVGNEPITVLLMASRPDLNEHTATTFGRLEGGRIIARQVGRNLGQREEVLARANWLLLASGDQGSSRQSARELSQAVREDGRFEAVRRWRRSGAPDLELWRRRPGAAPALRFDTEFERLAAGMEKGPAALAPLFGSIGLEHQLDGHRLYQQRVTTRARQRLRKNPRDREALWSLALLATLQNRPEAAQSLYRQLQQLSPDPTWPAAYRTVVLLADWKPGMARAVLEEVPAATAADPVIRGLQDLSGLLAGDLSRASTLPASVKAAVAAVNEKLRAPR
jgi:4-amino-4-deoxy-L-arabinose transferase-like glycosyltransferase